MNHRRFQDHYGRKAKAEGKVARSIYKLEEINTRWKLIKPGMAVLDLGCAPGSWLQYVSEIVGERGRAVGFDLSPVRANLGPQATTHVADVFSLSDEALLGPYDVVLSDMAPSTMGDRRTDALRSAALVERALDIADRVLKPGGSVVTKLLEGGEVVHLMQRLRQTYKKAERLRPKATRSESTELFLIGLGKS